MLYNILLYTWRILRRNKLSSAINITGFSIGITTFLLIVSYIKYEKGYDSFYADADNIWRVGIKFINAGNTVKGSMVQFPAAPVLKKEFGEVEDYSRVWSNYNILVRYEEKEFYEKNLFNVDPNFPSMFCEMLYGNANDCLKGERDVIISEDVARKYFGDQDPTGKFLQVSGYGEHKVTGVFRNRNNMSHFTFEILLPMHQLVKDYSDNWESHNFYTYLRLRDGVDQEVFTSKINQAIRRYNPPRAGDNIVEEFYLEPITDIRLFSDSLLDFKQNGHGHFIPLFVLMAVILLLFATFNYFNFATFQAIEKAKTTGINRILGAETPVIISLFIAESLVFVTISTVIGAVLAILLFPEFSQYYDMTYEISLIRSSWFWGYLGLIVLVNTVISGIYPAMISSSFKLDEVIRGKGSTNKAGVLARPVLAVVQYSVSCLLMIFSLVSYYQIRFMQDHDLGFDKEQVVVVREPAILTNKVDYRKTYEMIRAATSNTAGLNGICFSDYVPGGQYERFDRIRLVSKDEINETYINSVSQNFLDFYKIKLLAGRNFQLENKADYEKSAIINEKLAKLLGFTPEEALGQEIECSGRRTIIGVVSDFHQESLKKSTAPLLLMFSDWPGYFSFKLKGRDIESTVNEIRNRWLEVFPGNLFTYFFLDEYFASNYSKDNKAWQILRLCSGLAILISALGLWGAVVHQMRQSEKKIAMYKVMGASQGHIFWLFLRKTFNLILIAFFIGLPLDIIFLQNWLSTFPYRIGLNVTHFVIPLAGLLLIAFTTIGVQVFKVISSNLISALRSE